jgi:hypothetical protein
MSDHLADYAAGFRDGRERQAEMGCLDEMHLIATRNLPIVEADLAAERAANMANITELHRADADLAAARAEVDAAGEKLFRDGFCLGYDFATSMMPDTEWVTAEWERYHAAQAGKEPSDG